MKKSQFNEHSCKNNKGKRDTNEIIKKETASIEADQENSIENTETVLNEYETLQSKQNESKEREWKCTKCPYETLTSMDLMGHYYKSHVNQ